MARLPNSFNANEHESMGFQAFATKKAIAQIVNSEMKENSKKTGSYLQLDVKVLSGQYKGNHVFPKLNLDNPSETAKRIANNELSTICKACGKVAISDSAELHGIPFYIDTVIQKGDANNPDQTRITNYYKYDGSMQTEPMPQNESTPVKQQKQSGGIKPPWED